MADEDTGSQEGGAGSSPAKGPFDGLKESFNDLLKDFLGDEESREKKMTWTVHGTPVLKEAHRTLWKEYSSSLEPAKRVQDRAKALAFILQRLMPLLRYLREGTGTSRENKLSTLQNVRLILCHVCTADHSGYTPLHRQCFRYCVECTMVLDIFDSIQQTVTKDGPDKEDLRNKFHRLMHETGSCFLRCWSMIRSQDDFKEKSPALREDYQKLLKAAEANPDKYPLWDIAHDAQVILTEYICRLALNLLTGMTKDAKLKVNKADERPLLDDCKALLKGTPGEGALADKLGTLLKVTQDRYGRANTAAGKKANVDAFLTAGPATLPQDMECIAAECLDPAVGMPWTPAVFLKSLNSRLESNPWSKRPVGAADEEFAGQSKEPTEQGKERAGQSKNAKNRQKQKSKGRR